MGVSISIIIPVYQVEAYIEDCLRSVMNQTYTGSMECVVVDDCGSDRSMELALGMIAAYTGPIRFEVVRFERNRGLSAARNAGLEHATGDYVFFLDSDDEISENCIELLVSRVEGDGAEGVAEGVAEGDAEGDVEGEGVVVGGGVEMVQGAEKTGHQYKRRSYNVAVAEARGNKEVRECYYKDRQMVVAAWNKLIKRSFLMENGLRFIEGVIYEDMPWTFLLLKHLSRVSFVSESTYYYRKRGDSIVTASGNIRKAESYSKNYRFVVDRITPAFEREEVMYYGKRFAYLYAWYARYNTGFKEQYPLWMEKAREYGSFGLRFRLRADCWLGNHKFGLMLLKLWERVKKPSLIIKDLRRKISL